jgi:hypothetical protein
MMDSTDMLRLQAGWLVSRHHDLALLDNHVPALQYTQVSLLLLWFSNLLRHKFRSQPTALKALCSSCAARVCW